MNRSFSQCRYMILRTKFVYWSQVYMFYVPMHPNLRNYPVILSLAGTSGRILTVCRSKTVEFANGKHVELF